jgi:hypothetical protein
MTATGPTATAALHIADPDADLSRLETADLMEATET